MFNSTPIQTEDLKKPTWRFEESEKEIRMHLRRYTPRELYRSVEKLKVSLSLHTLLGLLTASCPTLTYDTIYCKKLERLKFLELLIKNNKYEAKITIKESLQEDLLK